MSQPTKTLGDFVPGSLAALPGIPGLQGMSSLSPAYPFVVSSYSPPLNDPPANSKSISSNPLSLPSWYFSIQNIDEAIQDMERKTMKVLKEYCRNYGLALSGNKADLVRRIAEYLKRQRLPATSPPNLSRDERPSNSSPAFASAPELTQINVRCVCQPGARNSVCGQALLQCTKCRTFQHAYCVNKNARLKPYECPLCLISRLDPMLPVGGAKFVLEPFIVMLVNDAFKRGVNKKDQEWEFNIRADQVNPKSNKKVYVRCIKLDGKSIEHTWPLYGQIHINGKLVESFQPPKDFMSHKRKDQPRLLRAGDCNLGGVNRITIVKSNFQADLTDTQKQMLKSDDEAVYVAAIVEVECLNSQSLIERIKTRNRPSVEESKKLFMEKLAAQYSASSCDDCICEEPALELSCADSILPGTMMNIPVYGRGCKHLQTFDLERFVKMNERVKLWKCPHCCEKAYELVVDTYFEQFLAAVRPLNLSSFKVLVDRKGNFSIDADYDIIFQGGKFLPVKKARKDDKTTGQDGYSPVEIMEDAEYPTTPKITLKEEKVVQSISARGSTESKSNMSNNQPAPPQSLEEEKEVIVIDDDDDEPPPLPAGRKAFSAVPPIVSPAFVSKRPKTDAYVPSNMVVTIPDDPPLAATSKVQPENPPPKVTGLQSQAAIKLPDIGQFFQSPLKENNTNSAQPQQSRRQIAKQPIFECRTVSIEDKPKELRKEDITRVRKELQGLSEEVEKVSKAIILMQMDSDKAKDLVVVNQNDVDEPKGAAEELKNWTDFDTFTEKVKMLKKSSKAIPSKQQHKKVQDNSDQDTNKSSQNKLDDQFIKKSLATWRPQPPRPDSHKDNVNSTPSAKSWVAMASPKRTTPRPKPSPSEALRKITASTTMYPFQGYYRYPPSPIAMPGTIPPYIYGQPTINTGSQSVPKPGIREQEAWSYYLTQAQNPVPCFPPDRGMMCPQYAFIPSMAYSNGVTKDPAEVNPSYMKDYTGGKLN